MIGYIIAVIISILIGFFIGILFAKRNPGITDKVNAAYLQGKAEAQEELEKRLDEAKEKLKDNKGSVEVSPISLGEFKKYLLRFGPALAALVALTAFLKPENFTVVLYKVALVLIGLVLAELVWVLFFKPVFGKTEEMQNEITFAVLVFRGMLYAAIIIALTLGL